MGLISRMAHADLLREAGRATLVVLEDTLVHSDSDLPEDMKRTLFDATSRHQIFLFICHPAKWRDFSVEPRDGKSEDSGIGGVSAVTNIFCRRCN